MHEHEDFMCVMMEDHDAFYCIKKTTGNAGGSKKL